jgi:hypothetical protein
MSRKLLGEHMISHDRRPALCALPHHAAGRGLRIAALALALGLSGPLCAQSITGGLHGTAQNAAGATIIVTGETTGYHRDIQVDNNGRYSLELLAPGTYDVSLVRGGKTVGEHTVKVSSNVSTLVPAFTLPSAGGENATELTAVQVSAQGADTVINPIDVSTPQLSTIWDAHLLHQLPINQQDIFAIPLLTSGARAASIQGEALPQVQGAGPTENRYYFNEFDTTYDVTGVGAILFPQEAVGSTQYIPSSGGAEWTSTTGAVLSATLKQGSNRFHAGYSAYYTFPTSHLLNPAGKDTYYTVNDNRNRYLYQSDDRDGAQLQQYLWASGPVVKDKLFYFVLLGNEPAYTNTSYSSTQKTDTSYRGKRALLNVTWNMTDSQSLDIAGYKHWTGYSANAYDLATPYTPASASGRSNWSGLAQTQKLLIGNYHWYINDDMSLRLMGGYMRYDYLATDAYGNKPYASIYYGQTGISQSLTGGSPYYAPYDYYYAKRGFKGDFTWNLGGHKLTLGAEKYKVIYHFVPTTNTNGVYQYYDYSGMGYGGFGLGNGGYIPASGLYGYSSVFEGGGTFDSDNNGYYLTDDWQTTRNLILSGGLRLDQMKNMAANGVTYLSMTTLSPRLGLSWDVHGDSSLKIGANAGKYTLPMPSTLSYAAASAQTSYYDYFSYTGINPDGTPIGYKKLGATVVSSDGAVPQLSTITSQGLKNTYQYEFQLYAQQQLTSSWSLMASADAHLLKNLIDQTCDQTGVISDYVRNNGHPNYAGLGGTHCIEFNPGKDIVLRDDLDAAGTLADITIPNAYLRMPAASRKYYGLTLKLSHARTASEPYFLNVSYTWSHLYGNSDGYANLTKSTDPTPGYSGNYTFRPLTAGNAGNLAGDIRHQLVADGIYYLGGGFRVSGVLSAHTGTPYTCLGTYPDQDATVLNGEGAVTHYCLGKLVPEGATGRTPTYWQLNLGLGYDLDMHAAGQLSIDLRMTNVTNRSGVTSRNMTADNGQFGDDGSLAPAPSYYAINALQAPRATFLSVRYTY